MAVCAAMALLLATMAEAVGPMVTTLGEDATPAAPAGKPAPLKPAAKPASGKKAAAMPTKGEGGSTGCPTMDMAYQKFKGDMRAIEQAAAAASKRALDAEKKAENEREAASRCLAAQRMLKSGPEADQAAVMQKEILRQVAKVKQEHSLELAKVKEAAKARLKEAVQAERSRQDKRIQVQLKAATDKTKQVLGSMKSKFEQLQDDTKAKAEKTKILVARLQRDLAKARQHATNSMAGAQRAREADSSSVPRLREINANNIEAIRHLKEALKASQAEARACESKHAGVHRVDADMPCPMRMTQLLEEVNNIKQNNRRFQARQVKEDQRLGIAKAQLRASREQVASLEKEADAERKRAQGHKARV